MYMTLSQYTEAAIKIINNYKKKCGFIQVSDDLIANVVRYMATADQKYNEGKAKGKSPDSWRQQRAIFAIRQYVDIKKKRKYIPFTDIIHEGKKGRVPCDPNVNYQHDSWKEFLNGQEHVFDEEPTIKNSTKEQLDFLIKNSGLTQKERIVIDYLRQGMRASDIALKIERSIQCVYLLRKKAFIKIRNICRGINQEDDLS